MAQSQISQEAPARLLSLDFFRGATVAAMILVNNPGDWGNIYAPLEHASWNGCTPTDLIFPFFLFIVGVSIAYAMGSKKNDPSAHGKTILKALKRGLILFGLGLFLSLYPKVFTEPLHAFERVRIPGVLQRIAVVFFISAVIFLKNSEKNIFKILIAILAVYWALMTFIPVPGVGYANLEKETNLGAWLDRSILSEAHLWKAAKTWDPEGILSTLPAIASGLFGVLVGVYLKRKDVDPATKIAWLFCTGLAAIALGLLWDLQFPINKSLWTSSFVLYTGGLATMILSFCYWIIDIQKYNRFTKPFVVYGVNAITVFFLSGLIPRTLGMFSVKAADGKEMNLQSWLYSGFTGSLSPINASLAWAITYVLFWLVILWIMYNRKIIIKV
ncbi:MAG: heparan-alpha-glucosaminide N-acetyltransferase domain-containing protein [Candidatus Pedobacter colombiensis]|uniref:Heparan-alpha-glucosaminide N-acetyltransferase domain-containing protein n=1 Tax=Candidatus Pedobacter colombiensis TaxID=3121371 RepID=A0AAJ6B740_9SPHI|nr:heparan-alpha-glucosaminide N-acetyltransferase domain-containing protein [Pedobacter sp.]WEK19504.1 MAG: heparan-alpha-glucosaminide N-acetyltransferase domain-containing protein [Pedobacter sp.]